MFDTIQQFVDLRASMVGHASRLLRNHLLPKPSSAQLPTILHPRRPPLTALRPWQLTKIPGKAYESTRNSRDFHCATGSFQVSPLS